PPAARRRAAGDVDGGGGERLGAASRGDLPPARFEARPTARIARADRGRGIVLRRRTRRRTGQGSGGLRGIAPRTGGPRTVGPGRRRRRAWPRVRAQGPS